MPYVVTSECIMCGACISGCENNAITEGETQSHINPGLCIECGTCERNCPMQAIVYVEDSNGGSPPADAEKSQLQVGPGDSQEDSAIPSG